MAEEQNAEQQQSQPADCYMHVIKYPDRIHLQIMTPVGHGATVVVEGIDESLISEIEGKTEPAGGCRMVRGTLTDLQKLAKEWKRESLQVEKQ